MGAFPDLSRNVLFCPCLSSFVVLGARNGDKLGQKRTTGDKTGHFGTNWELSGTKTLRFINASVCDLVAFAS